MSVVVEKKTFSFSLTTVGFRSYIEEEMNALQLVRVYIQVTKVITIIGEGLYPGASGVLRINNSGFPKKKRGSNLYRYDYTNISKDSQYFQ